MGSNGLTSARHDIFHHDLAKISETFDPSISSDLVYSGTRILTDHIDDISLDIGKLVLSPTRTYAPVMAQILKSYRSQIHGMVHCSGEDKQKYFTSSIIYIL